MTQGIHHITAIASNPQACYDFYTKTLGLRLVKKSVNQDQTEAYHLFFGDKTGEPGMDLTFFTFEPIMQGVHGVGQVTRISLAVPEESLDFWRHRFEDFNIEHEPQITHFDFPRIRFIDADRQQFELVGLPANTLASTEGDIWTTLEITSANAIRAFHSSTLTVSNRELIDPVLKVLGYELQEQEGHISLYQNHNIARAAYLEVEESPLAKTGINAAGTVHHIAFQVEDEEALLKARAAIFALGVNPTGIIDRYYFKSVYFRTSAGILFELATAGPGFTVDEPEDSLGQKLALPPFLEEQREAIESRLVPINVI